MRLSRFYIAAPLSLGQHALPEEQAHYIGRVLRHGVGDAVQLFDGSGQVYQAAILSMGKKSVSVSVQAAATVLCESPLPITLLQSVSSSERMDFTIQKSVELGVAQIVPLMSERSSQRLSGERADKKVARWQDIAIAACEQCGRTVVPTIAPIISLAEALNRLPENGTRLLMSLNRPQALNQLPTPPAATLLVGPEGGFSAAEEALAISQFGFNAISLGPRVLRTETAALATIAAMQMLWGDFAV